MSIFGWCNDGFHEGGEYEYGTPCPGTRPSAYDNTERKCTCGCHEKE